jgi:serine/threonine-protein kinase
MFRRPLIRSFAVDMVPDLDASVQVDEVLAGKYRVEKVLGVGGMGVVVAATHLQLGQLVALKFIRQESITNPEIVSRFEREARVAACLRSEHVARTIDIGRLETGSPYIVMEYLQGDNLASLLRQQGKVPVALACDFIIQACEALAEAHSLGIVHRDLKPGNLFLANLPHGRRAIKILDFGISKSLSSSSDPSITRTQDLMGSPGYMSPEQMRSTKNVDGRSDLWSLGVILYELVSGERPFIADTLTALCFKIATEPPALPSLPAPDPGLEPIVRRALEKDPILRHQSAAELARALAPFASAESRELAVRLLNAVTAVPPSPSDAGSPSTVTTLDTAAGESRIKPARSRKLLFGGICGIAVGAVALGVGIEVAHGPASGGAHPTVPRALQHTPDRTPSPKPEGARPAQHVSAAPAATPPPIAPVPRPTPEPTIEPGPAATRAETSPSRDPDPAKPDGSNATTHKKPTEATPKPTDKRTKPKDKGKPTQDSFDPFGSPD